MKTNMVTITYGIPKVQFWDLFYSYFLLMLFSDALLTKYIDPIMFADDMSLFYSHENGKTLFQIVNSKLQLVYNWFLANKFCKKCKKISMHFKKRKYVIVYFCRAIYAF